jgi:hypothetical protein
MISHRVAFVAFDHRFRLRVIGNRFIHTIIIFSSKAELFSRENLLFRLTV